MNKKLYFLIGLLISFIQIVGAQDHSCGTDIFMNKYLQNNPTAQNAFNKADSLWKVFKSRPINPNHLVVYENNDTIYEIPVVFHVMHSGEALGTINNPSDLTINNYLNYLNESFAASFSFYANPQNGGVKVPFRFVMAKRTPGCNPVATNGINRVNVAAVHSNYATRGVALENNLGVPDSVLKAMSFWNRDEYYNIWLVNFIDGPSNTAGGYAYLPPAPGDGDGTVLLVEYTTPASNGNYYKAFPHELGHGFGLHHTFRGSSNASQCPTNTNNCLVDNDMVCDTEPHSLSTTCVTNSVTNSCTGAPFNNVQYNIMNYTNCNTALRFTQGQRERMLYHLFTYRRSLLNSLGGVPLATRPVTATVAPSCRPSTTPTNALWFQGGPVFFKFGNFETSNANYNYDETAYHDYTCNMLAPEYTLGESYVIQVKVSAVNTNSVRVWIDYNNNGIFETGERVISATASNPNFDVTQSITIPANAVTCVPIRVRVRADVSNSSTDPCADLYSGQVEDYAIVINPAAVVAPTVAITSSAGTSICPNTSVTFNSNITNLPANAIFRWYKNNVLVATGGNSYTTSSIANNDNFRLRVSYATSCGASDSVTSNITTMTIVNNVTPTISVATSNTTICQGQSVTLTSTITNGGTTPTYQWYVNNSAVSGATSSTYTTATLNNNDQVRCVLTSSATCLSSNNISSNSLTFVVAPTVTPSVSLATSNNNLCVSSSLTFTATPTNGGTSPTYQWRINGVNQTGTGATFTRSNLTANDVVTVVLTSNATCASPTTATSNGITVISTANGTATVTIASNATNNTICQNSAITFTASPTSGGTSPTYQWRVNGVNQPGTAATFTTNALNNGDIVSCILTSNAPCLGSQTATSNNITVTVTTPATPTVTISTSNNNLCISSTFTFTATPTNGGTAPSYQWRVNGVNSGAPTSSNNFVNNLLNVNDVVSVIMTSNSTCIATATATSNNITIINSGVVNPAVSIASNATNNTSCQGTSVTFTATPLYGGTAPTYQWRVNGVVQAATGATFTTNALANGNTISCTLTSNATCIATNTANSNVITQVVTTPVVPSVNITVNQSNLCVSNNTIFTATPTNGGTAPTYQWRVNGSVVTGSGTTYSNTNLQVNDVVTVVMTSNNSCVTSSTATSNAITMTRIGNITPTLAIISNKTNNTICSNESITFSATGTNLGTVTNYQWYVNGQLQTGNAATFTTATLANGAVVSCVATSNAICLTTPTATSNSINVTVNPILTPSVSISASHTNLCINPTITFTATATNVGTTPTYQWRVNGSNVTGSGATLTIATLQPSDAISVVVTTSLTCYTTSTAVSNIISVNRVGLVPPAVSIVSNVTNNTICQGTTITFTATPTNGGSAPIYQWKVNGNNVGSNSTTYATSALNNNDVVTCDIVSNATCISTAPVASNGITVTVNPLLTATVSITPSVNNICENTNVTFTATGTNTGTSPVYQWKLNGQNVGTNSTTYSSATLDNNDLVTCEMTVSGICVVSNNVVSNTVTMQVVTNVTPTISISSNRGTAFCNYDTIVVTATITNGGSAPTYQWLLNNTVLAVNTPSITLNSLTNADELVAILTSNERCVTTTTAQSNTLEFDVTTSGPITLTPDAVNDICEYNIIDLDLQNANGTITWYINDTLIPSQTRSSIPAYREGVYYAVNELNGCYSRSNTSTIVLTPMPAPLLRFVNGGYEVDPIYDTYRWYFNDAWVANNPTNRHIPHAFGGFKLCVTLEGCNACTETAQYPDPLGIDKKPMGSIKVYPNPTTGKVYIEYAKKLNVEIRAIDGRILKTEHNTLSVDISELVSGAYMLYLIDGDQVIQINKLFKD